MINSGIDNTGKNEWITEEGRLRMIRATNDSLTVMNKTINL